MSDKKETCADRQDIEVERFIEALLDNHIVPKRSGEINILNRAQRKMLTFPCIKDAYDMVHDSMIKVHDYQGMCWDDLSNCIKEIITNNEPQKINEREQYYKNECVSMLEDFIKCYRDNAKDFAGIPEFFKKTNRIPGNIIAKLYNVLMQISINNYLINMENYRCLLLNILEKMIIKEEKKTYAEYNYTDTGVMGPYAHMDLPMLERVTPWELIGEGLQGREDEIRSLPRYNPQYIAGLGVYGVFWEPRRWPYSFNDIYRDDGVYPTRVNLRH